MSSQINSTYNLSSPPVNNLNSCSINLYCQNNRHHPITKFLSQLDAKEVFIACFQECPPMDIILKNTLLSQNYTIYENTLKINYNLPKNGSITIASPQLKGILSKLDIPETPGLTSGLLLKTSHGFPIAILNVYAPYTKPNRDQIEDTVKKLLASNVETIILGDFNTQILQLPNQNNAITKNWPWLKSMLTSGIFCDPFGLNPETAGPTRVSNNSPHSRLDYILVKSTLLPFLHNFKTSLMEPPQWSDHKTLCLSWNFEIPSKSFIKNLFLKPRKLCKKEEENLGKLLLPLEHFLSKIDVYKMDQGEILNLLDTCVNNLISQFRIVLNQPKYLSNHNPLIPKKSHSPTDFMNSLAKKIDLALLRGERISNLLCPLLNPNHNNCEMLHDPKILYEFAKKQFLDPIDCPFPYDLYSTWVKTPFEKTELSLSMSELCDILSKSNPKLACGPEGVNLFMLNYLPFKAKIVLLLAINQSFERNFPKKWSEFRITLLPKKSDPKTPADFRPISIVNTFQKIRSKLILLHLEKWSISNKIFNNNQHGFRKSYSSMEPILKISLEKIKNPGPTFVKFIDVKKAYDSVPTHILFKTLLTLGVPQSIVLAIREHYNNAYAIPIMNGFTCQPVKVERGLRQGCCLSPILYNLYTNIILNHINDKYKSNLIKNPIIAFADDIVILHSSKAKIGEIYSDLLTILSKLGLSVNESKNVDITFGQEYPTKKTRYLGTFFESENSSVLIYEECEKVINSYTSVFANIPLSFHSKKIIINSIICPKIVSIISNPLLLPSYSSKIIVLYKKMISSTLKLPFWSSHRSIFDSLEHGGLGMLNPCHLSICGMASGVNRLSIHNENMVLDQEQISYLHNLFIKFNLKILHNHCSTDIIRIMKSPPHFQYSLKETNDKICEIYTDGSFMKNQSSGACFVHPNQNSINIFSWKLPPIDSCFCELFAIAKAMEYAQSLGFSNIYILSDCESAISIAKNIISQKSIHFQTSPIFILEEFIKNLSVNVHFEKVKAHSGVHFNEIANEYAIQISRSNLVLPTSVKNFEIVSQINNQPFQSKIVRKNIPLRYPLPKVVESLSYWWNSKNTNLLWFKWSNNLFSLHKHPPYKWENIEKTCHLCSKSHKMSILATLTNCICCKLYLHEFLTLRGLQSKHFSIFQGLDQEVKTLIIRGLTPEIYSFKLQIPNEERWSNAIVKFLKFLDKDNVMKLNQSVKRKR